MVGNGSKTQMPGPGLPDRSDDDEGRIVGLLGQHLHWVSRLHNTLCSHMSSGRTSQMRTHEILAGGIGEVYRLDVHHA